MMEQILSTLGLALRAGSVAVGEEPGRLGRPRQACPAHSGGVGRRPGLRAQSLRLRAGGRVPVSRHSGGEGGARARARAHELRHVRRDGYRLCRRAWQKARRARPGALRRGLGTAGDQGAARRAAPRGAAAPREERPRRKAPQGAPPKKPDAPPSREPKRAVRPKTGVPGGKAPGARPQRGGRPHPGAKPAQRWAGSRPVKKGKGSDRGDKK